MNQKKVLRGHDDILAQFRRALARGRLASTFLFVGPAGIGKRTLALRLAQGLLCERVPEVQLNPCGECPSCHQVAAGSHPDVETIAKPKDSAFIPVELLIGPKEHRMQEGLLYSISSKPYSGRRKIAILDDADYLNKEGANCLLKTLEEPPPKSLLILLGTSEQRQLPTIRSRCQIIRFQPLAESDVAELLLERGLCDDAARARLAAGRSEGSLERAMLWCDERLIEFNRELLKSLMQREASPVEGAKMIGGFVDEAGKESAAKRERLRLVVSLAEEFYRGLMLVGAGGRADFHQDLAQAVRTAAKWMSNDASVACLDVCLDAYGYIDANANQATFLEWWLDALREAASGSGDSLAA